MFGGEEGPWKPDQAFKAQGRAVTHNITVRLKQNKSLREARREKVVKYTKMIESDILSVVMVICYL